jgi:hypothetical protein
MASRRAAFLATALLFVMAGAAPALAQADPGEVARAVRDTGVYVEEGSDLASGEVADLVAEARNQGERLSIVVLAEDPGTGAVAFGDAVVDRLSDAGVILVVTPDDFGVVGEGTVYTEADYAAALDAADLAAGSDTELVRAFVTSLTGVDAATDTPEPATTSSGDGGGGFPWLLLVVLLVGGLLVFWMVRRGRKQATAAGEAQLAKARAEIQTQLDAVANDILDIEDEVRVADQDRVDELYQAASQTYQAASEELAAADTPADLLEIANRVEEAVWQLDSAEALLDGKSPPPKPEPKRLEVPAPTPAPSGEGPLGLPPRPSYPSGYERRPTRRSGGLSPGLIEMLIALGAGALSSRGRSGGGLFPSRSASGPPPPVPSRDDGFLPSPSRRGTTPSSPPSRRGTSGRMRMGRRRRRR